MNYNIRGGGREAVNIWRCKKQERRKVDKKDGAVDHCRTANQRWKLIGGEEEQAGAKAQQKNAPGLSSGPSTLPPPPSSSPTINSFFLSFPTLSVFTLIRLVWSRRFYLYYIQFHFQWYFYSSTRLSILSFYSRSPPRAKIGTINSNYRDHVNHQLCLYF